jgi:hypothetical protein
MQECESWEHCSNKRLEYAHKRYSVVQLFTHINSTGAVHELRLAYNISILRFH